MSLYPSDGAFDWKSFGRPISVIGALALAAAVVGFALVHGRMGTPLEPASVMFAWAMEWVGAGLFVLMAIVAWGAISITVRERGSVEITPGGVRRIFKPGKAEFLPLKQIAGFMVRPHGGVLLIDRTDRRDMIIPRSIEGYRDCIAELKALGIQKLPADRDRVWGRKKLTRSEWVFSFAIFLLMNAYITKGAPPLVHHLLGLALFVASLSLAIYETRKSGRFRLDYCVFTLYSLALVVLRWRPN
jgi:hypothetical protein